MTRAVLTGARIRKGKPCKLCPWRPSSVGKVDPADVSVLAPCATAGGPFQGCHKMPSRVCAGYLLARREDPAVAFPAAFAGVMLGRDVICDEATFPDYPALFAAHGATP